MKKDIQKIFLSLALFAFSDGLFYNFYELWMQESGLQINTVSIVISISSLLSVSVIFLCSNLLKRKKIKTFLLSLFLTKILLLILLFFLYYTSNHFFMKLLIMFDFVIDIEIITLYYPLIAIIKQSDTLYAKRGIIYSLLYAIGSFVSSILLGKMFFNFSVGYNFYPLFSIIFVLFSIIFLLKTDINCYIENNDDDRNILNKVISDVKKDKLSRYYLFFVLISNITYYIICGLAIIILVNYLNLSPSGGSYLIILLYFLSSILGFIIIKFLTFKNDYVNILIKYGINLIIYIISFISNSNLFFLISIIFTTLINDSYTHIVDAPYINKFSEEYQLSFCNLKEMVGYLGRSIGTFICGSVIVLSLKLNFLIGSIFCLLQIFLAIYVRRLRENDRK